MSAESERIDLNSDVVLSEPDNEAAVAEANRLNGLGKFSMAGFSVEVKEENKVRVLEGESKKEDLGSEGLDKVVNGGELEDLSSKVLESEECNEKDEPLRVNEDLLRSLEGEQDMEKCKGEVDLLGKDKEEGVSFDVEKEKAIGEVEKVESLDRGVSSAVNVSSNVGNSSHSESLEAVEPKTMESAESIRELKDDLPTAEVEEKLDLDESLDLGDSKISAECGPAPSDGLQNGVLEVHLEAETKETGVPRSNGNETDSFNIVIDLNSKSSSKRELGVGDLVWGKVRSHPWWPGQVCDPKAASRKAKKYSKRDAYLIAYFGDNTFAWNEASMVKPFLENFAQMEKHSNTQDFHQAIACALEEVSRRVEFGLACSCLSEEVFAKIKTQIIVNAGIQEELSRRDGGDSSLTVACFEPSKLVGYIKELAQVPYDVTHDSLELALARSRLLAFYRFKGYSQLPEFDMLGGILENDADFLLSTEKKHCDEARVAVDKKHKDDGGSVSQKKEKSMIQDCSSRKRKLTYGNITCSSKKEKSLLDLMAEKRMKTSTSENGSGGKAASKKRKAGDATSDGTPVKETKSMAVEVDNKPLQSKQTFRVGDSIRRVASQLNGSSPILKNGSGSLTQTKSKEKTISKESKAGKSLEREHSPDEMLLQLCLAAKDPMGVNNSSVNTFFSEFRDTVSLDLPTLEENEESLANLFGGNTGKELTKNGRKSNMSGMNDLPNQLGSVNESYWSERIGRSVPEDQNEMGEVRLETSKEEITQTTLGLDSEQKTYSENLETEAEKLATDPSTGSSKEDLSPTALILNFTDFDSVPSETILNKIFSRYGPLNESETEVFKKSSRAKVVFKRRSDAETAFSSAGKYSTFGPSLLSYRLKYLSSRPGKASPNSKKKRSKTDKASPEDNAK
ncbi:Serine/threonine-protein kinase ATM [Morus notabilis]|uniref:Serine/threonine-protein kinase ATM n=1 Tax=Morus notabilis TaxID=981085 RepID=W9RXC7_9ROSA|nr:uncharacterized protein LOC21407189 [Morus notabilis]EXC16276.1 Serine/threonine-protein kinase ATM [Morus notabilis]